MRKLYPSGRPSPNCVRYFTFNISLNCFTSAAELRPGLTNACTPRVWRFYESHASVTSGDNTRAPSKDSREASLPALVDSLSSCPLFHPSPIGFRYEVGEKCLGSVFKNVHMHAKTDGPKLTTLFACVQGKLLFLHAFP